MYFEMSCRNIGMLTADYCLCPHAVFKVIALCARRCFFSTYWCDQFFNSCLTLQFRLDCIVFILYVFIYIKLLHEFTGIK